MRVTDDGRRLLAGEVAPDAAEAGERSSRSDADLGARLVGRRRPRTVRLAPAVAARGGERSVPCPRTSCSATLRCATWRGGGPRPSSGCWRSTASASRKSADFGQQFVERIVTYCQRTRGRDGRSAGSEHASIAVDAFRQRRPVVPLFDEGLSVEASCGTTRPGRIDNLRILGSLHPTPSRHRCDALDIAPRTGTSGSGRPTRGDESAETNLRRLARPRRLRANPHRSGLPGESGRQRQGSRVESREPALSLGLLAIGFGSGVAAWFAVTRFQYPQTYVTQTENQRSRP